MKNIMSLEVSETVLSNYDSTKLVEYSTKLFEKLEKVLSGESQREDFTLPTSANCVCSILTQFGLEVKEPRQEYGDYHAVMPRDKRIKIFFCEGRKNTEIRICKDAWLDCRELRLAYFAFKAKMNHETLKGKEW